MDGRAFLDSARLLLATPTEANRRSAVSRGYFAILNEARAALERWGFPAAATADVEDFVVSHFNLTLNLDALRVADALVQLRNNHEVADYSLTRVGIFADDTEARHLLQRSIIGIDVLDQLGADPVRRAQVVSAIRAAFP